jgi:hypothetical protein
MNSFATLAIAALSIGKFSGLLNSQRIFKSHVQTMFEAVDKMSPVFNAADKMRAFQNLMPPISAAEIIISDHIKRAEVFSPPLMKAACAIKSIAPVNPLAGRV